MRKIDEKAPVRLDQKPRITMSERDLDEFAKAINGPCAPNEALRGALDAAQEIKRDREISDS